MLYSCNFTFLVTIPLKFVKCCVYKCSDMEIQHLKECADQLQDMVICAVPVVGGWRECYVSDGGGSNPAVGLVFKKVLLQLLKILMFFDFMKFRRRLIKLTQKICHRYFHHVSSNTIRRELPLWEVLGSIASVGRPPTGLFQWVHACFGVVLLRLAALRKAGKRRRKHIWHR